MAAITVLNKSNVPVGPFTRAQVAEKLSSGEFSLTDLAFVEGLAQWTPLRDVLIRVDTIAAPPPAVPLPVPLPSPAQAPVPAPVPQYSYAATMQPPSHLIYAGFWERAAAHLVDGLIICVPILLLAVPFFLVLFGLITRIQHTTTSYNMDHQVQAQAQGTAAGLSIIFAELFLIGGSFIISWLYYAYTESSSMQATYGKRLMGIRVVTISGERLTFARASGRFFGKMITGMVPFLIGYIMVAFTERKQALHDMIAQTLVVKN